MRISDWSSDVCSSDLLAGAVLGSHRHSLCPAGPLGCCRRRRAHRHAVRRPRRAHRPPDGRHQRARRAARLAVRRHRLPPRPGGYDLSLDTFGPLPLRLGGLPVLSPLLPPSPPPLPPPPPPPIPP